MELGDEKEPVGVERVNAEQAPVEQKMSQDQSHDRFSAEVVSADKIRCPPIDAEQVTNTITK